MALSASVNEYQEAVDDGDDDVPKIGGVVGGECFELI